MRTKLIAGGLGLFSYGVLLGWAVTGDHIESKMKSNQRMLAEILERKTSELAEAKTRLLEAWEDAPADPTEIDPETEEAAVDAELLVDKKGETRYDMATIVDEDLRGATEEETRSNTQRLIEEYTNSEDARAFAEQAANVVINEDVDNTPPFVISQADFTWDEEGVNYSKIDVKFYPNEDVILDDEDDLVENAVIDDMLGWRNLRERFGDMSDNPDVLFIRNRKRFCDYEVLRVTDEPLPPYIALGMDKAVYEAQLTAGVVGFRRSDAGD